MAAAARTAAQRIAASACWASAGYLLLRIVVYYFHAGGTRRHHLEAAALIFVAALLIRVMSSGGIVASDGREPGADQPLHPLTPLAFAAAAVVLYWPILFTGLFADDFVLLDAARAGRFTVWQELFRPALFVIWRGALALHPDPAVLLHAVNVVLHGINAFLVCRLARAIALPRLLALTAGALFLTFPAAVEAVSWPAGLQDVLMATCVLTVLAAAVEIRRTPLRLAVVTAAFVAGLTAKETAIAAPALLAALGLVPAVRKAAWTTAAWCAALTVVFLVVRFSLLPLPASYSPGTSRYAFKELLVRPFATLVVPFRADELLRHPVLGVASAGAVVLLLSAASSRAGWRDALAARAAAAAVCVLGSVAPVLAYFYVDADLLGSRYVYLAVSGWVLLLASCGGSLARYRAATLAPLVFLLALWIPATRSHVAVWTRAAAGRERILSAATAMADRTCAGWIVSGLPPALDGVPVFVNGFPEAARPILGEPIHVAPAQPADGQCRLQWTGTAFVRD